MNNLYRILGVSEYATDQQIRQAYRTLAKRYHPDLNPGDTRAADKFRELAAAYEILGDPILRSNYDKKRLRETIYQPGPFSSPATPQTDSAKRRAYYSEATWNWAEKKRKHKEQAHMSRRRSIFVAMIITFVIFIGAAFWFDYWVDIQRRDEMERRARIFDSLQKEQDKQYLLSQPKIQDLDSPFDVIFGQGIYDDFSPYSITVLSPPTESVICLVQAESPWLTIRNEYVSSEKWFTLRGLPKGRYFFKIYTGAGWDPDIAQNKKRAGGFTTNPEYFVSLEKPILLTSTTENPSDSKDTLSLQPVHHQYKKVSAEEFLTTDPAKNPQR